ncbi:glycosyl hydrolase family 28-related protein [Shouchella clausii]
MHHLLQRIMTVIRVVVICMLVTSLQPVDTSLAAENEDNFVRIKNLYTGEFLYEHNELVAYGDPSAADHASHWKVEEYNGHNRIKNRKTGHYINIENVRGHLDPVGSLDIPKDWTSSQWELREASTNGYYIIENVWKPGHFLHIEDRTGYAQSSQIPTDWESLQWSFESVEEDGEKSPPEAPINLTLQSKTSTSVTLTWESVGDDIDAYHVYRDGIEVDQVAQRQFTDSGLEPNTTYTYSVKASNANGLSDSSNEVSVTTDDESTQSPDDPVLLDAAQAFFSGGVTIGKEGTTFSGTGYLTDFDQVGSRVIFSVMVPEAGAYDVHLRYANGSGTTQTLSVYANGSKAKVANLSPTSNWDTWHDQTEQLELRRGLNTISIQNDQGDTGQVRIDSLTVPGSSEKRGRGATVSWIEYQAQEANTNGEILGYDLTYSQAIQSEASERQAVKLTSQGDYVSFQLDEPANALTLRYSIPDSSRWDTWLEETLSLYIDGQFVQKVDLTSKHSWLYGEYPYNNDPSHGTPHRFFDEKRILLDQIIPAESTVEVRVDSGDDAEFYVIDLLDAELVDAPYQKPEGYLDIRDYGAAANDETDDTQALKDAISAAREQHTGVWIPEGEFMIEGRIDIQDVTIRGAGMWYSTLRGKGGFNGVGSNIQVFDLAMMGETRQRDDSAPETSFDGQYGTGSILQNVWIQNTKVGVWSVAEQGDLHRTDGLYIAGLRIKNTFADGINLNTGTKNTMVEHTHIRNTGDDALAMYAIHEQTENNTFRFNTVQVVNHANGVGIYGGLNHSITDNEFYDTVAFGAGIKVSREVFDNHPNTLPVDNILFARNSLVRTGSIEHNIGYNIGAIWIRIRDDITGITFKEMDINNSGYGGIFFEGDGTSRLHNTNFQQVHINGTGFYGIFVANNARGTATFTDVSVQDAALGGLENQAGSHFELIREGANQGW